MHWLVENEIPPCSCEIHWARVYDVGYDTKYTVWYEICCLLAPEVDGQVAGKNSAEYYNKLWTIVQEPVTDVADGVSTNLCAILTVFKIQLKYNWKARVPSPIQARWSFNVKKQSYCLPGHDFLQYDFENRHCKHNYMSCVIDVV